METVDLSNIGIVLGEAGPELMAIVGAEVEKIQSNFSNAAPWNKTLAGNILHEYQITDCREALEKKVREMAMLHQSTYGKNYNVGMNAHHIATNKDKKVDLRLGNTWVNFQQKGEFNLTHNHTGMYSFVLWYKVPYYMNIEDSAGPGRKSNSNRAGKFEFTYTNILGQITGSVLSVDKTWEGRIALFPALLHHQVFPFYSSNDYRISISGNLYLVTE